MEVEYDVGACTPPELRAELERRLGAREGDTVILFSNGSVALGREASPADSIALTPLLTRLRPSAVYASFPPSAGHAGLRARRGSETLRVVR